MATAAGVSMRLRLPARDVNWRGTGAPPGIFLGPFGLPCLTGPSPTAVRRSGSLISARKRGWGHDPWRNDPIR